jgi:hypothetical protein
LDTTEDEEELEIEKDLIVKKSNGKGSEPKGKQPNEGLE